MGEILRSLCVEEFYNEFISIDLKNIFFSDQIYLRLRSVSCRKSRHKAVPCIIHCEFENGLKKKMERLYRPMLDYINSTRQCISIEDDSKRSFNRSRNSSSSSEDINQFDVGKPKILSLGIQLFLHECNYGNYHDNIRNYLQQSIWNIKLNVALSSTYIKSCPPNDNLESYVANGPMMPWWAIRTIHSGKEVIRINLFVNDLDNMLQFYEVILRQQPQIKRKDFCCFTLVRYPEFDFQFSLKALNKLSPKPTPTDDFLLEFFHTGYSSLVNLLPDCVTLVSKKCWKIKDPEGNTLLLHEKSVVIKN
ncbi:Protein FAM124A [Trichoplax sp. H2]|nr:Protein FAM124A [Trichoplax sp. H2]|eukprot:RDD46095.1 Protein FAM124A [Trichoplax sp. H2]